MASRIASLIRIGLCVAIIFLGFELGVLRYGPASAQQTTPIMGNHLNNPVFSTEMADAQRLQGAVVMALNNREQAEKLAAEMQDRDSLHYHQWLTPAQFTERFGPTPAQMQAVVDWLGGVGLTVTQVNDLTRTVAFAGTYAAVKAALQVKIVTDGVSFANVNDPEVPAELAPTIESIEGLVHAGGPAPEPGDVIVSSCTLGDGSSCGNGPHFGPTDLYTFYDANSVLENGNLGTGAGVCPETAMPDCIAIPADNSFAPAALSTFTTQFGSVPGPGGTPTAMPPLNYAIATSSATATPALPTTVPEVYLDMEWVHAVSPNTPLRIYYTNGIYANGLTGYLGAIAQAVIDNQCGVISSSTEGGCQSPKVLASLDSYELQATMQGQTMFKSSGDYGSNWFCGQILSTATIAPTGNPTPTAVSQANCGPTAGANFGSYQDSNGFTWQPSIDEEAASSNITVVGGTQSSPVYGPTPAANDLSTAAPGFEVAWNANLTPTPMPTSAVENCPVKDASTGGSSRIFSKPAWQATASAMQAGVPNDGSRDVPDVAMGAWAPYYFMATQNVGDSSPHWTLGYGTSIATPMWAGVSRLLAQAQGVCRLGNINARLYELGTLEWMQGGSAADGLIDIVSGNNSDNGIPGYSAGPGYDLVTGWGSPDIAKLIMAFPGAMASPVPVNTQVNAGQIAPAGSFMLTNTTAGPLSVTTVKVNVSAPAVFSSLSLSAAVGSGSSQVATATPAATAVFTFSPPITIPVNGSATFTLSGATASSPAIGAATWGTGGSSRQPGAGKGLLGAAALLLTLAALVEIRSRRRTLYPIGGLLLLCAAAMVAESCGSSSNSPVVTPTATATVAHTATPTAAPTATPTAAPTATPTAAPTSQSSQSIPAGGIVVVDGQNGRVEVSNLPAALGSITVMY